MTKLARAHMHVYIQCFGRDNAGSDMDGNGGLCPLVHCPSEGRLCHSHRHMIELIDPPLHLH